MSVFRFSGFFVLQFWLLHNGEHVFYKIFAQTSWDLCPPNLEKAPTPLHCRELPQCVKKRKHCVSELRAALKCAMYSFHAEHNGVYAEL